MTLTSYLGFNGDCKAAFEFYRDVLRGEVVMMMTYGESPMAGETAPDQRDKVIHARLAFGDAMLMGSDAPPSMYQKPQGMHVAIGLSDTAEAERIYAALSDGATVQMEIQKTFWAARFAMLIDRFGTPWMINCEEPA